MSEHPSGPRTVPKPDELLALHGVAEELFDLLRMWFGVPSAVALDLGAVDSAVRELGDPLMIAALAMRKLQALHLLATPGVRTTTDVVVTIVQDLQRALLQAPRMRLQVKAIDVDWDAELAHLGDLDDGAPAPHEATDRDAELERFRELHGLVNAAVAAVVDASDGEIVVLV
jgi:hypothetical protein